ncbi:TraB/GumN family protein [Mucilaginibacter sp. UYCu711]|uniref:TraB/GumN family protein n=1 Tax=Mucilaginibacter sp. UYCu711 TaxID=3156339 RepID=UPI003D1D8CC6
MKSVFCILFLFLVMFAYSSSAQKKQQPQSVLWKIQSPLSHKTSYLLGTLHLFGQAWITAHPKVDSLIKLSDIYICEVIANNPNVHEQQPVKTPTHVKAKELFGKNYDKVNQYFIKTTGEGLQENIDNDDDPAEVLKGMTYFLSQVIATQKGFKIAHDLMDNYLLKEAIAQNKLTVQLDNDKVPRSVATGNIIDDNKIKSIVNLVNIITDSASINKVPELTELNLYDKGKYSFNFTAADKRGEQIAKAITRNNFWMKKLPAYLIKGKVFITVGAGHLDGKDGLLMQLKKRGYKVSPVNL